MMRPDKCCACPCCGRWRDYFQQLRRAWATLKGVNRQTAAVHWPTTQPLIIPADREAP